MAVSVTRTVIAAYKSVRTNQRQHSGRFSKKKRHIDIKPSFRAPQLSLVWNRDYSLMCPFRADSMDWAFDEGAVYGTAKLIFRHGKFFLYVPVTINVPDTPALSSCKKVVGIDRGIRFLAVACDGKKTSFYSGAVVKQKRAHYKELRIQLQKRQTSSARRRIRAIGQRENRWMNDVNHCISAERKPLDERCEPSYL